MDKRVAWQDVIISEFVEMLNYVDPATGSEVLELEEVPSREQYASRVGSNGSSGIQARGLTERICSNTVL